MNQYFNSVHIFLIILLLILFSTFSCKKKDDLIQLPVERSPSVTESSETGKLVFGSIKPKSRSNSSIDKVNSNLTVIDTSDVNGQLFPIESRDVIPEDMEIGSLLDFCQMNVSESSFSSAVITFFTDAEKGILNQEIVHPLYFENIKKLFGDELNKQSYTLRIGRIVENKGILSVYIRLVSNTGRVSGIISADNLDGKWLLSDISIDMKKLKKEYLKKQSEYDPLSYSNILLNY